MDEILDWLNKHYKNYFIDSPWKQVTKILVDKVSMEMWEIFGEKYSIQELNNIAFDYLSFIMHKR